MRASLSLMDFCFYSKAGHRNSTSSISYDSKFGISQHRDLYSLRNSTKRLCLLICSLIWLECPSLLLSFGKVHHQNIKLSKLEILSQPPEPPAHQHNLDTLVGDFILHTLPPIRTMCQVLLVLFSNGAPKGMSTTRNCIVFPIHVHGKLFYALCIYMHPVSYSQEAVS